MTEAWITLLASSDSDDRRKAAAASGDLDAPDDVTAATLMRMAEMEQDEDAARAMRDAMARPGMAAAVARLSAAADADAGRQAAPGEKKFPYVSAPGPQASTSTFGDPRTVVFLGGLFLAVGAVLPWATMTAPSVGTISAPGYLGDGMISGGIGLAIGLGALAVKGTAGKRYSIILALLGVAAVLVAGQNIFTIGGAMAGLDDAIIGSIGAGVYVSIIGGILALVGGLMKVPGSAPAPAAARTVAPVAAPSDTSTGVPETRVKR